MLDSSQTRTATYQGKYITTSTFTTVSSYHVDISYLGKTCSNQSHYHIRTLLATSCQSTPLDLIKILIFSVLQTK